DALESRAGSADLVLDLSPLKAALRKAAPQAAADYAKALPVRAEKPAAGDFSFRPEGSSVAVMTEKTRAALLAAADKVPARVEEKNLRVQTDLPKGLSLKAGFDRATFTLTLLSAVLIAGLALMAGGGSAAVLSRAGSYLIPPSVLVLVPGILLALPGAPFLLKVLPLEAGQALSGEAAASLRAYFGAVLGTMSRSFFVTGLVGVSLGAALKSFRRIFEPREI
ncbi:MAG: hypothetical protein JNG85_11165, partial [Spirochaetaceae bacterium]|nr:hypothetical protein [Spirochaetaceae bacterium]